MSLSLRLASIENNATVDSFFVVSQCREATTRHGSTYLTLELRDASGQMSARVWQPATACVGPVTAPGIYRIRGRAESFREEIQLQIDVIEPYTPRPHEYAALLSTSKWDPNLLRDEVILHLEARLRAPAVRRLVLAALGDPTVAPHLLATPAATHNHHAYRGGLLEHMLSMLRLATRIATHYANYYPGLVDEDLLLAGVVLHDLGKVWELEGELTPTYSDVGRLVGHIPMGAAFVATVATRLGDIPDALVWELQHLVLSHHGQLEFGSPRRPKTVEAQILHLIDILDARTNTFADVAAAPGWTPHQRTFGHPLLNPSTLREAWTTPPAGNLDPMGPGGRYLPGDAAATGAPPTATSVEPEATSSQEFEPYLAGNEDDWWSERLPLDDAAAQTASDATDDSAVEAPEDEAPVEPVVASEPKAAPAAKKPRKKKVAAAAPAPAAAEEAVDAAAPDVEPTAEVPAADELPVAPAAAEEEAPFTLAPPPIPGRSAGQASLFDGLD